MRILRSIAELRAQLDAPRRASRVIGLVPTMGALHDGHVSLIRSARARCDVVVVTLFVNPAQFDDAGDLRAYPRDEERDARLAREAGADILFAPAADAIYPPGFATTVTVGGVSGPLEGESRGREHFAGVATVVTKLLNIVQPDVAFFGQKDAQQVAVIRRLVRDLDIPVRIEVGDTIREPDGLALSSRNRFLTPDERQVALVLSRALATRDVTAGRALFDALPIGGPSVSLDYLERVDSRTFEAAPDGDLIVVAAKVGTTRLIDNLLLKEL